MRQTKKLWAAAAILSLTLSGAAFANADLNVIRQGAASDPVTFVSGSPRVLIVSDFYTYGTSPFPNEPSVDLWVSPNGFGSNVAIYLYLLDRDSGNETFLTLDTATGDLEAVGAMTPLFGTAGSPILVPTPDLSGGVSLFGNGSIFGDIPGLDTSTGSYAVIFELRNEAGNVISRDNAMFSYVDSVVVKGGTIGSETWSANNAYLLADQVFVGGGSTLTIEPGTVVMGEADSISSLGVLQGATINADCTAVKPCRFTSSAARPDRQTQDFGGIIINGFAPTNLGTSPPPEGEGNTGPYGGDNPADNSGTLDYVVIEYAGRLFNAEDELNCLALQGVGTGTTLSNIQCIGGSDDGVEFFGGTANASNLLLVNNEDDQLDWTSGWVGNVTNVCAVHSGSPAGGSSDSNNCIEADNDSSDNDSLPRSNPTITNFACVRGSGGQGAPMGEGLLLRRGTGVDLNNAVISNVFIGEDSDFAIDVDGDSSQALVGTDLTVDAVVDGVAAAAISNVPIGGVNAGNSFLSDGANFFQPQLAPRSSGRGCTTRNNDWTTGLWVQNDWGQGN
ncbi:MAG: hypothetical protein AAGA81_12400 [Acidobacteriota bacterium]